MSIELFKLNDNNEYKLLFGLPKIGTCDFMQSMYKKYFYEEISKYSNLPSPDTCPVLAGQYDIKQYPFDMKKFAHFKRIIKPGSYRMHWFLVKDDVAVCGLLIYGRVTEKS